MRWKITLFLIFIGILPISVRGEVNDKELAKLVSEKAETYALKRDWENALNYYEKAAELDSIELYRYTAAYAATQCKPPRWDVAERLLRPNKDVDSRSLLAEIHWQQGHWNEAYNSLQTAEGQVPGHPRLLRAWGEFAYAHWKVGKQSSDAQTAIRYYRDYLGRKPNSPYRVEIQERLRKLGGQAGSKLNMAIAVLRAGDLNRAWELLNDVEALEPDGAELAFWRGKICMASSEANSHYDETGATAERYWRRAESLPQARMALANFYWNRGDVHQALQEAEVATKQAPGWVPPLLLLGEIYRALEDYPKSRKHFQEVVRLAPNSVEAEGAKRALETRPQPPDALVQFNFEKFMEEYGPEVADTKILTRLEEIVFRLYKANGSSGTFPQIRLLASRSRNAFSIPPDHLFVTVGLLEFVDSQPSTQSIADDVLAFVLGHEWTHIIQSDYERSEKVKQLMAGLVPRRSVSLVRLRSGLGRIAEANADRHGLLFAYRAGYNPYAAIVWCEATIQAEGDWEDNGDHPSLRERGQVLRNLLEGPMRGAYQSFKQGVKALKGGDLERATRAFEAYLRLFPNDGAALENLSTTYFLRGVSLLSRTPWDPWQLKHDVQIESFLPSFPSKIVTINSETHRWWDRARRLGVYSVASES